jgi:HK97 family phage major capsid protein
MATRSLEPPGRFSLLGLLAGEKYELGMSKLAADKYGAPELRGEALPHSRLVRDLGLATATGGGNLAATELAAVAAAVRPQLVFDLLGAERLEVSGASDISLPRFDGGVGGWISEGDPASSMSTTVQTATATAHCAAARLGLSRKVRNGSGPDTEAAILAEISAAVQNTIEQGFIQGSGSNSQPLGLVSIPGIGRKTFISSTPTWSELVDMGELLCNADGDVTRASWLLSPSMAAALLLRLIDGNGGELVVTYSDGRHRIAGIPLAISSNVPATTIILAQFDTVQQVFFGAPQIIDDRFSAGKSISGASEIVVMNFCDVVARNPGLIVVGSA